MYVCGDCEVVGWYGGCRGICMCVVIVRWWGGMEGVGVYVCLW